MRGAPHRQCYSVSLPLVRHQFPDWAQGLFEPCRYKVLHGGRGSGKSWAIARALLIESGRRPLRVLCTREVQKSIRDSVHRLLADQIELLGVSGFYEILDTEIRGRNGSLFVFSGLSALTVESIKSYEGIDRVWVEEAQSVSDRSWNVLIPTIRKDGSEIWVSFNPQLETDPTYRRFVKSAPSGTWRAEVNWDRNPWFGDVLEAERLHAQRTLKSYEYAHIWEGACLPAVEGAIYADEVAQVERERRVVPMTADPLLMAHTVWDLGWNDSMAIIVVQRAASEVRIIDYIEDSHRTLPSYVEQLHGMRLNWATDWLPHDGFATRHQTGRSDDQVLEALQRKPAMIPRAEVEKGIRAARMLFPRVWFNEQSDGVQLLLEHLRRYRRNVTASTGEPGAPRHDEHSHGADAFRGLALVADQLTNAAPKRRETDEDEFGSGGLTFVG